MAVKGRRGLKSHRIGEYRGIPLFRMDEGTRKGRIALPTFVSRSTFASMASAKKAIDRYRDKKR